jgi:RNA polymerase sigma-70 factor (ECF subfamily)
VQSEAEDFIERLRRGETEALGAAYDAHHRQVRAFAARLLGDRALAEDLVQETFLTLPSAARNYRGDGSLASFVLGIAARQASHFVRAAARRRATHEQAEQVPRSAPGSPEEVAHRRELAARLTRALDALTTDQRLAVVLCEVEGRSSVETSSILGVPEGTVRTRVFHAKKKLRELLGEAAP